MNRIIEKKVKDLAIPLDKFAVIRHDATIYDVLMKLERKRNNNCTGQHDKLPLLVSDDNDRIIGKIGILCCLRALIPNFCVEFDDIEKIKRLDEFHSDFLESILCRQLIEQCNQYISNENALDIRVVNIMYSISESIDGDATLMSAINKIVNLNSLSILVTAKSK
ncbi:MAG: hypothetical protein QG635_1942, partial [Bacteroidota bacterium]|nr:hypothetical protein [Bacteroidota bacterium]